MQSVGYVGQTERKLELPPGPNRNDHMEIEMATHAPITGAPTRAPVILAFPDTPLARARRELRYVRNPAMLEKWKARLSRSAQAGELSHDDKLDLACRAALRLAETSLSGGR